MDVSPGNITFLNKNILKIQLSLFLERILIKSNKHSAEIDKVCYKGRDIHWFPSNVYLCPSEYIFDWRVVKFKWILFYRIFWVVKQFLIQNSSRLVEIVKIIQFLLVNTYDWAQMRGPHVINWLFFIFLLIYYLLVVYQVSL